MLFSSCRSEDLTLSRPSPSPCPHSFITLSFFPFATSCSFNALCFSACPRFLLSSLCSTSLWAFHLILFVCLFVLYSHPACFHLQSLLFLPDFLWGPFGFESATTSPPVAAASPSFSCLGSLTLPSVSPGREEGRARWGSGCSFQAFSHPRTVVYVTCHGHSFPSTGAPRKMGIALRNLTCSSGRPGNRTGAAARLPSEPPHESSAHPIPSHNLNPRPPGPAEARWATESPRPLGPTVLLTETRRTEQWC